MAFSQGDGTPRFNPFFIPKMIADIAAGFISIKYGFRGPNFVTVSACASSANAMIDALNFMEANGWEFVSNYVIMSGTEVTTRYILRKSA